MEELGSAPDSGAPSGDSPEDFPIWSDLPGFLGSRLDSFFPDLHEKEIVLLHGFIKKTRKTPTEDRALALQRKNAYLKNS